LNFEVTGARFAEANTAACEFRFLREKGEDC